VARLVVRVEGELNHVLILTRNNLALTQRCVESVRLQDIDTSIIIRDNGSTDGTRDWLDFVGESITVSWAGSNLGVSNGWNAILSHQFDFYRVPHVLVIGNDTILPRYCYSALLSVEVPFVTGVDIGMNPLPEKPDILPLSPHPDFSCFLIRRECWEKVGPFDENMVMYSQDQDYHIRAHHAGVHLWKASVPYQHERSSTLNRAPLEERNAIHLRANLDRAELRRKWGVPAGGPLYEALFSPGTFGMAGKK
jgi:GT2 family glycosyltransferase